MAATKASGEATMFPRMIEVIVRIIAAGIVADPFVVGVDVRSIGMALLVRVFCGGGRGVRRFAAWCAAMISLGRRRAFRRNVSMT